MTDRRPPDPKTLAPILRQKPRGRPFGPDNPGRPFAPGTGGRPKGVPNKATTMIGRLFAGEAADIGRRTVELAHEGHVGAIRLILDRTCPPRSDHRVEGFTLPPVKSAVDVIAAMTAVVEATASGAITLDEGRTFTRMLGAFHKMYELADIEPRIAALEADDQARRRARSDL